MLAAIKSLSVTLDMILPTLEVLRSHKELDGFLEICIDLRKKIVSTFVGISVNERQKFYMDSRGNNSDLVQLLMEIMVEEKEEGSEAVPNICVVNSNSFYSLYVKHKDDPAALRILDDIMNNYVINKNFEIKDVICSNCFMPKDRCKFGQNVEIPHVGLRFQGPSYTEQITSIKSDDDKFEIKSRKVEVGKCNNYVLQAGGGSFVARYHCHD